tara:strand:+ start:1133 stop:1804 length:672 start_codon:yes stop_codon:yes gene_type:complete
MSIYYKIELFLNLLKYSIREKFFKIEDNHILFLQEYFKEKTKGLYIDVGCYHPIRLSTTKFLHDKGWMGINIDISKKSIDLFKITRKKDINLNIGIGNKNKISEAYFKKSLFHANTLDYEHSEKFLGKSTKRKIAVRTLQSVINEYVEGKMIDLIDIDCEGKDQDVLQGLDFSKNKIDLISIEMHAYDENIKKKGELIFDIMERNKFKKIYGNYPATLIFKKF